MGSETKYWVIEAASPKGPIYWSSSSSPNQQRTAYAFNDSIQHAVRFSRRSDAETVRLTVLDESIQQLCRAVEHLDLPGVPDGE